MMMNAANACYPNGNHQFLPDQEAAVMSSSMETGSTSSMSHSASFLYNLSVIKDKLHQVESLAGIFLSPDHDGQPSQESTAIAVPTMGTLIQEIIVTASTMMFACQQMSLGTPSTSNFKATVPERPLFTDQTVLDHWYEDGYTDNMCNEDDNNNSKSINNNNNSMLPLKRETDDTRVSNSIKSKHDIIELAASDLLAKYTHYCHVCGKGFKRDANLRMHMRAHGDEYKSSAALSNPAKNNGNAAVKSLTPQPKYSCPQEGCRWNKNHAKFQPLKSMICVKNHFKRSHCPKMYVCKRCTRKQFSVLSDLRTHEKHCGNLKWRCSCGTTFSRKDKLMGHVALFTGHMPAGNLPMGKIENAPLQIQ